MAFSKCKRRNSNSSCLVGSLPWTLLFTVFPVRLLWSCCAGRFHNENAVVHVILRKMQFWVTALWAFTPRLSPNPVHQVNEWGNHRANQKWQAVKLVNIQWHVAAGPPHLLSTLGKWSKDSDKRAHSPTMIRISGHQTAEEMSWGLLRMSISTRAYFHLRPTLRAVWEVVEINRWHFQRGIHFNDK